MCLCVFVCAGFPSPPRGGRGPGRKDTPHAGCYGKSPSLGASGLPRITAMLGKALMSNPCTNDLGGTSRGPFPSTPNPRTNVVLFFAGDGIAADFPVLDGRQIPGGDRGGAAGWGLQGAAGSRGPAYFRGYNGVLRVGWWKWLLKMWTLPPPCGTS